jgi:hypothetical protein
MNRDYRVHASLLSERQINVKDAAMARLRININETSRLVIVP